MCMEAILHGADISNTMKPFKLSEEWSTRVLNEFWDQVYIFLIIFYIYKFNNIFYKIIINYYNLFNFLNI